MHTKPNNSCKICQKYAKTSKDVLCECVCVCVRNGKRFSMTLSFSLSLLLLLPLFLSLQFHLNLNLASLASSYAKFIFTQVVPFDANCMAGDREHERCSVCACVSVHCIKTAFELILLPLSTVHVITFVVLRFVSFTNSHSQSRWSLRIQ